MTKLFDLDMIEAKKIAFLKPIFEDNFTEKGMKAWLTDIVKDSNSEGFSSIYKSEFLNENDFNLV